MINSHEHFMANEKHVRLLKRSVSEWNFARRQRYDLVPDLIGADLRGANLSGANLTNSNLEGADLRAAILVDVIFGDGKVLSREWPLDHAWSNLSNADLTDADLTDSDLGRRESNLKGLSLRGAKLRRAKVRFANLNNADLTGADLSEADLTGAKLARVCFNNAILLAADFTSAESMELGRLRNTKVDSRTVLPSYLEL